MSTKISVEPRPICQPIHGLCVNMSTNVSVKGCIKYTWSPNFLLSLASFGSLSNNISWPQVSFCSFLAQEQISVFLSNQKSQNLSAM